VSSTKKLVAPAWYKNTYFWLAAILLGLAIIGLPFFGGDESIRDPGQKRESNLYALYFGAAVVMFINGWLSHRQTVKAYHEHLENPN
jgi:hypothetical protein